MKSLLLFALCLAVISWLMPNHYLPWLSAYQDFSIFLALIFICIYSLSLTDFYCPVYFLAFILIVILLIFFQFIFDKIYFFGDMFISIIYIFAFLVSFLVSFNLYKKHKKIYLYFILVVLFTSIFSVYIALKQWLLISNGGIWIADLPPNARPFANFAQPNTLATFLCIGLMANLYLYEKKYLNKITGIITSSLIIFGIALTQSRTSWMFSVVFIIWWLWKTKYLNTRLRTWQIFLFMVFYGVSIILLPNISNFIGVTSTTDVMTRATTGLHRIAMWHQMLIAISNSPWFGYGWNQVSIAQVQTTLEYPVKGWTEHTHNIILDILIWNGIPIGFTLIGFIAWWLYRLSHLITSIEPFLALTAVGAVLTHAMLEYPLEYAFFLLPIGFLLGMIQTEEKRIRQIRIPRYFMIIILILSSFLYFWVFLEYRLIEKDIQLARFESLNIGLLHAQKSAPNIMLLTQLREQVRFIRTKPNGKMSEKELVWMREVSYRYANPTSLYRYAQALALNKHIELAKQNLAIIENLHDKKLTESSLYIVNNSLVYEWKNSSAVQK